jgi:hypothetical protein
MGRGLVGQGSAGLTRPAQRVGGKTLAVVSRRQADSRTWTTTTEREEEDTDERSS